MRIITGPLRFIAALFYAVGCITLVLVYLQWVAPEKKRNIIRTWAAALMKILGFRVDVEGEVYPKHCLIVANHISFIDIFALDSIKPGRFIAKSEIESWPIFGRIAKGVDTLFIKRKSRRSIVEVNDALGGALAAGQTVMLFPEGQTTIGLSILPFKPNLIEPAVISNTAVVPVALCYYEGSEKTTKATYANVNIFKCLWTIAMTPNLSVKVIFTDPIIPNGKNRLEVARAAAKQVAQALDVPNPMPEDS